MNKNTSNVSIQYKNSIAAAGTPTAGVCFIVANTPRGPLSDPSVLISNPGQLEMFFGKDDGNYPEMEYIIDLLQAGGKVRISRVLSSDAAAASGQVKLATTDYFKLSAKNKGAYGNKLSVQTLVASDGDVKHFNMVIQDTETGQTEKYPNIDPSGEWGGSGPYTYLDDVVNNSTLVTVAYDDLSSVSAAPTSATIAFTSGSDGSALQVADYKGSQASNTGVYAFDNFEDAFLLTFPGLDADDAALTTIDTVGVDYANAREDIMYIGGIPNSKSTQTTIVTWLSGMGSSRYTAFVGGGLNIKDTNGSITPIMSKDTIVGHMCKAQGTRGIWVSPAGTQAGTIEQGLSVVNNFGANSRFTELNAIANAGGDMLVFKNGLIYLKDAYTMSQDSVDKFISVVMTDIYLRKLLVPIFEDNLQKPNYPTTWVDIYYACKPYLDQMVQDGAIMSYTYSGDQFASSPDDYAVNLPADVAQGKYKVNLSIQTISPMVEVNITIIKTLDGVTTS